MAGFQAGLAARHIELVDLWDYDKRQREMVEADAGNMVVLPELTRLIALKRSSFVGPMKLHHAHCTASQMFS